MKKKILILSLGLMLAFTFSACGKKDKITSEDSRKEQYENLTAWLKSGKGVICEIETPEGAIIVKSKGEKVRMDGMPWMNLEDLDAEDITKGSSITDGDWMYMWSGQKGMKMNLKELAEMAKNMGEDIQADDYSWEDWASEQDEIGVKYICSETKISDDVFTPPAEVEFADWSEFMRGLQSFSESFGGSFDEAQFLPSIEGSQGMTQEEIEAQLEKIMRESGIN